MRPLVWTDGRAAAAAACLVAWLVSVEVGTSRQASKIAASASDADERVVDTTTSRLFDVTAFAALSGGVAASLVRPAATIPARRMSYLVGALTLGGSGRLSASARQHLGRFHRDALTVHSDHELVDTGPYRRVRHPLYTATIGVFLGIGAVLGNWISVGLTALPTSALLRRIHVEEDMLIEALGPDYLRYRERTARLVPGIW